MDPRIPSSESAEALALESTPFDAPTIARAFVRPDVAIDVILASPARFAATLASPQRLRLAAVTLVVAVSFAVPFGAYFGLGKALHVAGLFVGSVLVCYPSLHVFAAYVGLPLRVEQSAALAMLTAAVASVFSFGFAPIVFFLRATVAEDAERGSMTPIVHSLLTGALVAGMVQVVRCVCADEIGTRHVSLAVVLAGWFALLGFIAMRMGHVLGLGG